MEKPEIKIDEWCTGPQGMRFELYTIKDLHTDADINTVKAQLYRDRDVVQIKATWLRAEGLSTCYRVAKSIESKKETANGQDK